MFRIFGRKHTAGIDITNSCNLRCKYCYHKDYLTKKDNTPLTEWEKRFREYRKMGARNVFFMGGEPSLRYDVLKLAENYFPYLSVFTNGQTKIPKEFNYRIFLSLDGLKEQNDAIRGKGTYEKVLKNYKGDKRVIIHSVLSKENYRKIENFIKEVRKMDVCGLFFSFYGPRKGEDNSLVLNKKQREHIKEALLEELKRKDSILLMTKEMIDYLVKRVLAKRCAVRENIRCYTADNRLKYCVTETADCTRCGCLFGCISPPLLNLSAWFRHKKMVYDWFFSFK